MDSKNVLVYLEGRLGWQNPLNNGLLTEGARIAQSLGSTLSVVTISGQYGEVVLSDEYGISTHYRMSGEGLADYNADVYTWAFISGLKAIPFKLLLFADTATGRDLAPRVAFALDTAAVLACSDIRIQDKGLVYVRYAYGCQLEQEVSFRDEGIEVVTIKTDNLYERPMKNGKCLIIDISLKLPLNISRTKSGDVIAPNPETMDILYSKRIVGIGTGCAASLSQSEELARLLDASIATTRPMVDDGLIPKSRMIGQTGKTVSPEMYFALGISGSPHHVAGIQQSKTVISINKDPRAPVFGFSDTGFVADVDTLIPKLIERIKRYQTESGIETKVAYEEC